MNFIRELHIIETITEAQKIFVPSLAEGKPDIQLIGTRMVCKVWNEDKSLIRVMQTWMPLGSNIDDGDMQELIEETYRTCELSLIQGIKRAS